MAAKLGSGGANTIQRLLMAGQPVASGTEIGVGIGQSKQELQE